MVYLYGMKCRYVFADFVAWLCRDVLRYRRDVVMTNLARSFPDRKYGELKRICRDFYTNLGDTVAEALWFGSVGSKRLHDERLVELEDPAVLNSMVENHPNGTVVMDGHFFNWELFGGIMFYNYTGVVPKYGERTVCTVYKELHSKRWDRVFARIRQHHVVDMDKWDGYIEEKQLLRHMISHQGEGRIYSMRVDQHPYQGTARIPIGKFLHQDTETMCGSAVLARKYGMAVYYGHMEHDRRGHYVWSFTRICDDASSMDVEDIMRRYYDLLQADVERNPSNYLWTHKRWK